MFCYIFQNLPFFSPIPLRICSDVSTTMIIQPGPVVDFLIANQNVRDPFSLDWMKVTNPLIIHSAALIFHLLIDNLFLFL